MDGDPYEILGVARGAGPDEIRRAYREQAKRHHPDLNPGDADAEDRFKAISAAHGLLGDPERRAAFDRGEIDASGEPRAPERPRYRHYAEADKGARYGGGGPADGFADLFGDAFGDAFGPAGGSAARPRRGRDERYALEVGFLDAVRGATSRLTLPDGRTLDVQVPAGIEAGQTLRLRGRGGAGRAGGPDGDALIEIAIGPHALFRREGDDIRLDLPVTLKEAVLGARIEAPTPTGPVTLAVPAGSDSGRTLRLRGRGVPAHAGRAAGDLYVRLVVSVGAADPALAAFLEGWTPAEARDPRAAIMGAAA